MNKKDATAEWYTFKIQREIGSERYSFKYDWGAFHLYDSSLDECSYTFESDKDIDPFIKGFELGRTTIG